MANKEFEDVIVWGKKSLSDLLKEVYDISRKKDRDITDLINDLKPFIKNIGDAVQLVPLIAKYLDITVQNNDQLTKMLQIVQRASARTKAEGEQDDFTPEEIADLKKIYEETVNKETSTKS